MRPDEDEAPDPLAEMDEAQKALADVLRPAETAIPEAEPVFDAEGNITEFSILGDEEEAATEDEFGSDLDDEDESEDATHPIDALLTAIHDKGWNGALDALAAKFSATGAFLEVSAAIEKLRK